MDGCYCFLTLVISFLFGAACCTVWDCRLFLQCSQFTEESFKLCNDVVAVFVMDVCYCFVDACCYFISFWRGLLYYCAAFCTVWDYRLFLVLSGISYYCCVGSHTAAWDLVLPCRFSYSYCMGSRTTAAWDLVLPCHFLYCVGSRTAWNLVQNQTANAQWRTPRTLDGALNQHS